MSADKDIVERLDRIARFCEIAGREKDGHTIRDAIDRITNDAAEIVRLRGEVSKIDAWVRERLPESFHGMAALDVMRLILEGGIAAEQDLLDTAAIAPEETSVVGGFDHRLADMLLGILNDIQNELGFTDEEKECANGSAEIVAAIRELKERATLQPAGGEAVAWLPSAHEWMSENRFVASQDWQDGWNACRSRWQSITTPPAAQVQQFPEYLKDPATVHALMLRGAIATPTWRSMVDLRGEAPNGEDAQLSRIAQLQEQLATHPAAGDKVRELLAACKDELIRRKLVSHPLKFAFAKERGLNGLDEVHDWMIATAQRFESALEAALAQPQSGECPSRHRCDCIGACKYGLGGNGAMECPACRLEAALQHRGDSQEVGRG